VHNEVTFRSLEIFSPKNEIQQTYKSDFQDSASYTQAGSFFPDWYAKLIWKRKLYGSKLNFL
jgi:hypothetical protein